MKKLTMLRLNYFIVEHLAVYAPYDHAQYFFAEQNTFLKSGKNCKIIF